MDPVKIREIVNCPTPTKKKELQSFSGLTNFYRRFIKAYGKIVKLMMQLTGNKPWKWGKMQQDAFKQLKMQLAEDMILAIPNNEGKFCMEADASEGAIGAVLSQEQDGKWRPVLFLSKSLSVTKQNYKIYDKELLAIMLTLEEWRHYLMGAYQDFEIWIDHQNLQYFWKPQKVNRHQACWITKLAEYHFTLHHKVETVNKKADLLSWQADHDQGKDDNDQVVVLTPEHFKAMIMLTLEETHHHIRSATWNVHLWDNTIVGSVNHDCGMKLEDRLIWYNHWIYILCNHALHGEIITHSHDHITARHPGIEKTKEWILQDYWWPKIWL